MLILGLYVFICVLFQTAVVCGLTCFKNCLCNDDKTTIDCSNLGLNHSVALTADVEKLDYSGNHFDFIHQGFFLNLRYLRILNLSNSHIFDIHQDAFGHLNELLILDLSSNFLSSFHLNLFINLPNLRHLNIKKNFFASLFPGIFSSLQSLEFLDISHNFLKGSELWPNLVGLVNIKTLYFYGNTQRKIESDTFSLLGNTSLENLDLSNTNIEFIDEFAFSKLSHLNDLNLNGNLGVANVNQGIVLYWLPHTNITSLSVRYVTSWKENISWSIIRNMKSQTLQKLDISFNYIRIISEPIFQDSPKINHLILRHMQLDEVNLKAFEPLKYLEILDLSFNNLKTLFQPVMNFSALQHLKELDLSNNQLVSIATIWEAPTSGLSDFNDHLVLPNLEILRIENNELMHFDENQFNSMPKLKHLIAISAFKFEVAISNIPAIRKLAFRNENLECLDLSRNHFQALDPEMFSNYFSLKELYLGDNRLGPSFRQGNLGHLFDNLKALSVLDLSFNDIDFFSIDQFSSLNALKVLNLNHNKISIFPPDVYDGLKGLEKLIIKANEITVLESSTFQLLKNLKEIDFSENPLQCQCDVMEFFQWINFTNLTITNWDHLNDYFCPLRNTSLKEFLVMEAENECLHNESNIILICAITVTSVVVFLLLCALAVSLYRFIYVRASVEVTPKAAASITKTNKVKSYDAFICYTSKDAQWLPDLFKKHLGESRKLRLYFHDNHKHIGRTTSWDIMNKVDNCYKVVFIITKNFVQTDWFQWESMMIMFQDCAIIVGLEDIPTANMSYTLQWLVRTKPFVSWPLIEADNGLFWDDLAIYIKEDANRKSPLYI